MSAMREAQWQEALDVGNRRRSQGAEFRRRMASLPPDVARAEAARMLVECPETVGAMQIHHFLEAVPRVGPCGVRLLLGGAWPIWPLLRVRELTDRQRRKIADRLRGLED